MTIIAWKGTGDPVRFLRREVSDMWLVGAWEGWARVVRMLMGVVWVGIYVMWEVGTVKRGPTGCHAKMSSSTMSALEILRDAGGCWGAVDKGGPVGRIL